MRTSAHNLAGGLAEPAGGGFGVGRSEVHAGAGTAVHAAFGATQDAMRAGLQSHIVMDDATADALMLAARVYVHALWDQAVALAAEDGPMPLVAVERWRESDADYQQRIEGLWPLNDCSTLTADGLDNVGRGYGLPRARLVPVAG